MAQLQQMQQNLENGVQHEEIPLNRTNSAIEREEREERIKIRRIFDSVSFFTVIFTIYRFNNNIVFTV